ncbi:MAG: magnesium transporter, partial [Bacilli bacterium]
MTLQFEIEQYIADKKIRELKELLEDVYPADIADVLLELSSYNRSFLLRVLDTKQAAEIFAYLEPEMQESLIIAFTEQELEAITDNLYSDELVDLIEDMPVNIQRKILKTVSLERRPMINALLNYGDDKAGSIMSIEYIELRYDDTCAKALLKIKEQANEVESIDHCYVIDEFLTLVGGIDLRDIVINDPSVLISEILDVNQVSVLVSDHQEDVIEVFRRYDLTMIPVVSKEHKLVGIITIDDVIDALDEETTEDIHRMNAISPLEEQYKKITVMTMYKKTIGWLLILMVTATLTQGIMSKFEATLATLAIFIPMLMDTGGNAGGQSASIIIRALTLNEITPKDYLLVIKKEVCAALLLGVTLASVNFVRMILVPTINASLQTYFVVSLTLIFTVVLAK